MQQTIFIRVSIYLVTPLKSARLCYSVIVLSLFYVSNLFSE